MGEPKKEPFEGIDVTIAGEKYIVPALSLGQMEEFLPAFERLSKMDPATQSISKENNRDIVDVLHAAFSRNYPEITKEDIKKLIDLKNVRTIVAAVKGESGFVEGDPSMGEQTPVA